MLLNRYSQEPQETEARPTMATNTKYYSKRTRCIRQSDYGDIISLSEQLGHNDCYALYSWIGPSACKKHCFFVWNGYLEDKSIDMSYLLPTGGVESQVSEMHYIQHLAFQQDALTCVLASQEQGMP